MPHLTQSPALTSLPSLVSPPVSGKFRSKKKEQEFQDIFTAMAQGERVSRERNLLREFRRRIRRRRGFLSTILTGPLGATEPIEGVRRTLLGGGGA